MHVLREDAYVHRANQQDFGPIQLGIGGEVGIARGVGAEHDELGRGFHIALPAFAACGADGADLRADGRVAHADDADDLHKAGRRRGLPR